jgi:hypothetical protein
VKFGSKELPNRLIEDRADLLRSLPKYTSSRHIGRDACPDASAPVSGFFESSFSIPERSPPAGPLEMCASQFLESGAFCVLVEATKRMLGWTAKESENYLA